MKREAVIRELSVVAIALLASIAVGSILMLVVGKAPGHVWWLMITRTLGDSYALGQVLYKATPLVLTGLAVSIALDAGLFNLGAEGSVIAGVVGCATTGTALPEGTPAIIAVAACAIVAALSGAAIGGIIGALRVYRNVHTVISSIIFNAIVAAVALWLGNELLFQNGTTTGPPIIHAAELPQFGLSGSSANGSLIVALGIVAVVAWIRTRTTWGRALIAVGRDPEAARTAGIGVGRVYLFAMLASGALAGLAATNFVLGHKHAFEDGLGAGSGLLGISAALLGRGQPVGVAIAALVLGFMSSGGLAVSDEVPKELSELLQGVIVLSVACASPFAQRLGASLRRSGSERAGG